MGFLNKMLQKSTFNKAIMNYSQINHVTICFALKTHSQSIKICHTHNWTHVDIRREYPGKRSRA